MPVPAPTAADLTDALDVLKWGSTQPEQSAPLSPAQCRALLAYIESKTSKRKKETTSK